jgi:uncharacterized membrane protein YvlD (DUF360 family)
MQQRNKKVKMGVSFMLHPKYSVHLTLSIVLNLVASAVIIGFALGTGLPLVEISPIGYLTAIILFTLIENFVKILVYRYLMKYVLMSFGLITYIINVVLFFAVDQMLGETFHFMGVEHLMIFTLLFSVLRFILTHYYQRYRFIRKMKKGR